MAPVTVYTESPVAAKPTGVTPQTALPGNSGQPDTAPSAATAATTSPTVSAPRPQAQPGARPSPPAPSASTQAYPSLPQPTPTQSLANNGPPPPQPGAVPRPAVTGSNLPPPPKAGEKFVPPSTTAPYPHQMAISSPAMTYPAQQFGTCASAGFSSAYSSQGRGPSVQTEQSLAHPPGYHQDVNASGLNQYQSSAAQHGNFADGLNPAEDGVWDTARKWAQATGAKLAAAENEVWKKINKG